MELKETIEMIFQLSPLHEGRHTDETLSNNTEEFQLSPLHEGRLLVCFFKRLFFQFQLSPLHEGRRL